MQDDVAIGSFNTFVLLTSSLTMVLSIAALQRNVSRSNTDLCVSAVDYTNQQIQRK